MAQIVKPFFSIIIPTLNEEKYLPSLLQDLVNQTFRDFEVIVVDGNSIDKTLVFAKKYQPHLPTFTTIKSSQRNVSIQRNLGGNKGKGQYLVFMDADNRLPIYYLEGIHYRLLASNPDLFTTWCTSDDKKPMSKTITFALNLMIEGSKTIEFENALGALIGCKKTVFTAGNGFDAHIPFAEDGEFIRRYVKEKNSFAVFHDPQFVYSLRRFRANGTLKTLQQTAALYIRQVTNGHVARSEYPMGGHVFIHSKKTLREAIQEIRTKIQVLLEQ